MSSERFVQAFEVFSAALDCDTTGRPAFVARACGGDAALLADVERLLADHVALQTDRFLEPAPLNLAAQLRNAESASRRIGKRIGAYQLKRLIGSGGMGDVYEAVRLTEFTHSVAIKILRRGMDSDDLLRRFRNEMQFLADVGKHPHIAGLLDAGVSDEGLPYYVMEYVAGQRIDEYCTSQGLPVRERLRVFQSVCAAVQFAHQHGLIHRDLKPGNILIAADGQPRLIDFGIAKLVRTGETVDEQERTETELRVFTPHYASPEQVHGEPCTTVSDVYSLGVVLYELLVGQRPYRLTGHSPSDVERIVCQQEPPRPSAGVLDTKPPSDQTNGATQCRADGNVRGRPESPQQLRRLLAGDLDNVVLKALRKDPRQRYPSVAQLSDDVDRYLAGRPVTARRIGTVERTWRWCRNNPLVATLSAALVAFVVATAVVSPIVGLRMRDQRDAVLQAEQKARSEAETSRQVADFLTTIYASSDPYLLGISGAPPAMWHEQDRRRVELLARSAEQGLDQLPDQSAIKAQLMHSVGTAWLGLGRFERSETLLRGALDIRRRSAETKPVDVAVNAFSLGRLYVQQQRFQAARPLLVGTLDILRHEPQPSHPLLGPTLFLLGRVEVARGQRQAAIEHYREALAVMLGRLSEDREKLARAVESCADLLMQVDSAKYDFKYVFVEVMPVALEFLVYIVNYEGEEDPLVVLQLFQQMFLRFVLNDYDGAARLGSEGLTLARRMFGERHWMISMLTLTVAWAEQYRGNLDAADERYRQAYDLAVETLGEQHLYVAAILGFHAGVHRLRGDLDQAESKLRRSLAIVRRSGADAYPQQVRATQLHLAIVLRAKGNESEARRIEQEATKGPK